MKTLIATIVSFVAACTCSAETVPASQSSPWSYGLTECLMSQYYGSWVGGIFRDAPFSFTTVSARRETTFGSFYVSGSIGQTLDKAEFNKNTSQEIDGEAGVNFSVSSGRSQIDATYFLSFIAATPLNVVQNDFLSHVVRLEMPNVAPVKPYVTLIRSDTVGKVDGTGWFAYGGLVYSTKLSKATSLSLDYRTGYSFGIYGAGKGWAYHRIEAAFPVKAGKKLVITPAIIGQTSAHGQPAGHAFVDRSRLFATCTFNWGF